MAADSAQKGIRALVIGGGLGGLTAAIALRRAGVDAVVHEAAKSLQQIQVGVGMVIWTNGIRALQRIGLGDRVSAVGTALDFLDLTTTNGRLLAHWPVGDVGRTAGGPSIALSRADLHRALAQELPADKLRLGAQCTGFTQDETGVTVRFADGAQERGDVLIGADGVRSRIRSELGLAGPDFPPYAGYTIWHSIIDFDSGQQSVKPGTFWLVFGCGSRFGFYRIDAKRVYWSGIGYVPAGGQDAADGRKREVLRRFAGWHAPIEAMIQATDEKAIHKVDIFGGKMLPSWGAGRVALLGDAAHPMTTNLGQGACMAIEDGLALGDAVGTGADRAAELRAYEARRLPRVAAMLQLAQRLNSSASLESAFRCWMRNQMIRLMFGRGLGREYEQQLIRAV